MSTCGDLIRKWQCVDCTYLNYASSTKCTICKRLRRIEDDLVDVSIPNTTVASTSTANSYGQTKWSCIMCTYLNFQSAIRCTYCRTARNESPTTSSAERIRRSVTPPANVCQSKSNDSINDHVSIARALKQWSCPTCTYENWPKAQKCVMCQTSKPIDQFNRCLSTSPPLGSKRSHNAASTSNQVFSEASNRKSPRNSPAETPNDSHTSSIVDINQASANKTEKSDSDEDQNSNSISTRDCTLPIHSLRHKKHDIFLWLMACASIPTTNDVNAVESYLAAGGDPNRIINKKEAALLNAFNKTPTGYKKGQTLLHLAYFYNREDLMHQLEQAMQACKNDTPSHSKSIISGRIIKLVPSSVNPERASQVRRMVVGFTRQRKLENLRIFAIMDFNTFYLPKEISSLPSLIQDRLFAELLDHNTQHVLEEEHSVINWSLEITDRIGTRLHALWNRTQGDCLLDAVLQSTYGIFDTDNTLRQALSDSLRDAESAFYERWRDNENTQAHAMCYELSEQQLRIDWAQTRRLASQQGSSLDQLHVFALAHIIRRPIIVYAVPYVKSAYDALPLDYARFEGVYLPLLWEVSFCSRSPVCLGYTRGHFCALAPFEPLSGKNAEADQANSEWRKFVYLPLVDSLGHLLSVPFVAQNERGNEMQMLSAYLNVHMTDGGVTTAEMTLERHKPVVQKMIDEWLDYYCQLANPSATLSQPVSLTSSRNVTSRRPIGTPKSSCRTIIDLKPNQASIIENALNKTISPKRTPSPNEEVRKVSPKKSLHRGIIDDFIDSRVEIINALPRKTQKPTRSASTSSTSDNDEKDSKCKFP